MRFSLSKFFSSLGGGNKVVHRRCLPRRRPELESLEARNLLAVTFSNPALMSGDVTVTGNTAPGQFLIQLGSSGGATQTIRFSDNNGQSFTTANLVGITSVTVNGVGRDTLTLDATNGVVGKAGTGLPINFNPGVGASTLVLQGNTPATTGAITEVLTAGTTAQAGTLTVAAATVSGGAVAASSSITFASLSLIQDTTQANSLTVNGPNQNSLIEFRDGPLVNGVQTNNILGLDTNGTGQRDDGLGGSASLAGQGAPTAGTKGNGFVSINFANKTTVTVNAQGANEFITLNSSAPAPGLQTLNLNGGSGGNNFYFDLPLQGVTTNLTNLPQAQQLSDPNQAFVQDLYIRFLGRVGSISELAYWRNQLDTGGPDARTTVIRGITGSDEALNLFVNNAFQQYLGRNARGDETPFFRNQLQSGGSEEQVLASVLGSPEFNSHSQSQNGSGTMDQQFVQNLYQVLLVRTPSQGEVSFQTTLLQSQTRTQVALSFLQSQEFRDNVVTQDFSQLLNRAPSQDDFNYFNGNPSLTLRVIREGFLTSPEFTAGEFGNLF